MIICDILIVFTGILYAKYKAHCPNKRIFYNQLFLFTYILFTVNYIIILGQCLNQLHYACNKLILSIRCILYILISIAVLNHAFRQVKCWVKDLAKLYNEQLTYANSVICLSFIFVELYFVVFQHGAFGVMVLSSFSTVFSGILQTILVVSHKFGFGFLLDNLQINQTSTKIGDFQCIICQENIKSENLISLSCAPGQYFYFKL